jgi:hypothetical protein
VHAAGAQLHPVCVRDGHSHEQRNAKRHWQLDRYHDHNVQCDAGCIIVGHSVSYRHCHGHGYRQSDWHALVDGHDHSYRQPDWHALV